MHFTVGPNNAKSNSDASSKEYQVIDHEYDAVVVGAGFLIAQLVYKSFINK